MAIVYRSLHAENKEDGFDNVVVALYLVVSVDRTECAS